MKKIDNYYLKEGISVAFHTLDLTDFIRFDRSQIINTINKSEGSTLDDKILLFIRLHLVPFKFYDYENSVEYTSINDDHKLVAILIKDGSTLYTKKANETISRHIVQRQLPNRILGCDIRYYKKSLVYYSSKKLEEIVISTFKLPYSMEEFKCLRKFWSIKKDEEMILFLENNLKINICLHPICTCSDANIHIFYEDKTYYVTDDSYNGFFDSREIQVSPHTLKSPSLMSISDITNYWSLRKIETRQNQLFSVQEANKISYHPQIRKTIEDLIVLSISNNIRFILELDNVDKKPIVIILKFNEFVSSTITLRLRGVLIYGTFRSMYNNLKIIEDLATLKFQNKERSLFILSRLIKRAQPNADEVELIEKASLDEILDMLKLSKRQLSNIIQGYSLSSPNSIRHVPILNRIDHRSATRLADLLDRFFGFNYLGGYFQDVMKSRYWPGYINLNATCLEVQRITGYNPTVYRNSKLWRGYDVIHEGNGHLEIFNQNNHSYALVGEFSYDKYFNKLISRKFLVKRELKNLKDEAVSVQDLLNLSEYENKQIFLYATTGSLYPRSDMTNNTTHLTLKSILNPQYKDESLHILIDINKKKTFEITLLAGGYDITREEDYNIQDLEVIEYKNVQKRILFDEVIILPELYGIKIKKPVTTFSIDNPIRRQEIQDIINPTILITEKNTTVMFECSENTDFSYECDKGRLRTFIHDFTFSILSKKTDISFKELNLILNNKSDNMTPDYMEVVTEDDEQILIVFEFTTTRSDRNLERSMMNAFIEKKIKYEQAISSRIEQGLISRAKFIIIVVGTNTILCNDVELIDNNSLMQLLCQRFNIAVKVMHELIRMKLYSEMNEEILSEIDNLRNMFTSIEIPTNNHGVTLDMYKNFVKPVTYDERSSMYKQLGSTWNVCRLDALEEISKGISDQSLSDNKISLLEEKTDFYDRLDLVINKVSSNKSPIQIPLIIPTNKILSNSPLPTRSVFSAISADNHEMEVIWGMVGSSIELGDYRYISELELAYKDPKLQEEIIQGQKRLKYKNNRVKIDLGPSLKTYQAKLGVCAKKFVDFKDVDVLSYRKEKTASMDYSSTDVRDIDEFISRECLQFGLGKVMEMDIRSESIMYMLKEAMNIHGQSNSSLNEKYLSLLGVYSSSLIGSYLRFISDLSTELAISMSQNCEDDEYILKKLKHFDAYMLIKPTRKSEKIFFSLLIPRDLDTIFLNNKTFKGVIETDQYYMTEWVSSNLSKLTNLCRAESMGFSLITYWCEFYGIFSLEVNDITDNVIKMTWLSILILLEDKHRTEELLTQSRFIVMEAFVGFPLRPNPQKMYKKFDTIFRSRLQIWVLRKFEKMIEYYATNRISTNVISSGNRLVTWSGLINPFIMIGDEFELLNNQDQAINLFYIGYLKNKDESPEGNTETKLLTKIIGKEDLLPEDKRFLGLESKSLCTEKPHEFNSSLLKQMVDSSLMKIMNKIGARSLEDSKSHITNRALFFLSKDYIDMIATLKASSNFSKDWYTYKPMNYDERQSLKRLKKDNRECYTEVDMINKMVDNVKKGLRVTNGLTVANSKVDENPEIVEAGYLHSNGYHRSKTIEKVLDILKPHQDDEHLYLVSHLIKESLEIIESGGNCLHICIFKKNQHGGLREIYVLDIFARIIQRTIENISRSILIDFFPSETMTHPSNKFIIPETHYVKSYSLHGQEFEVISTSDDAEKWNQLHHVNKFILMLVRFTSPELHGFIIRTLQLWHNKKIMIPEKLLMLLRKPNLHMYDDLSQRVYDSYNGISQESWMEPGTSFIKTESGMMQGILHYTSSLFHCLELDFVSDFSKEMIKSELKLSSDPMISYMVSSDDSGMMITKPLCRNGVQELAWCTMIQSVFNLKTKIGISMSIYKSLKSTTFTPHLIEFNSEFIFGGDVHRPTFRWVNAAFHVTEQETLMARQEEASNLMSSVIEGGGSIHLSYIVQLSQALMHYRLLGSSVSPLWLPYVISMSGMPDPSMGFFLLDPPTSAGLLGLQYNLWRAVIMTQLGIKYKLMIQEELRSLDIQRSSIDTISMSLLSRTTLIRYSTSEKWRRLINKMGIGKDWFTEINNNPEILYFHPKTKKEVYYKILVKLMSPGVISSFSNSNTISRVLSSSVYILSRPVLTTCSAYYRRFLGVDDNSPSIKLCLIRDILIGKQSINNKIQIEVTKPNIFHEGYRKIMTVDELVIEVTKLSIFNKSNFLPLVLNQYLESHKIFSTDSITSNNVQEVCTKLSEFLGLNFAFLTESLNNGRTIRSCKVILESIEKTLQFDSWVSSNTNNTYIPICITNGIWIPLEMSLQTIDGFKINLSELSLSNDDLEILFPYQQDYNARMEELNNFNFSAYHKCHNIRRKIKADVNITSNSFFSGAEIEKLVKFKWFGKEIPRKSIEQIEANWSYFKKLFPWLRDTPSETLKESRFETHIQLQNFFSRLDKGYRTVHLVGATGRRKRGHLSLLKVIKYNFSNGIVFDANINLANIVRSKDLNYVLSNLAFILESPLQNKLKKDTILKYLSGIDTIETVKHQKFDLSLKLNCLQEYSQLISQYKKCTLSKSFLKDKLHEKKKYVLTSCSFTETIKYSSIFEDLSYDPPYDIEDKDKIIQELEELSIIASEIEYEPIDYVINELDNHTLSEQELSLVESGDIFDKCSLLSHRDLVRLLKKNVVNKVFDNSMGVLGSFYGKTVWRGMFHNYQVEIITQEKGLKSRYYEIVQILIDKPTISKLFVQDLKSWASSVKVNLNYDELLESDDGFSFKGIAIRKPFALLLPDDEISMYNPRIPYLKAIPIIANFRDTVLLDNEFNFSIEVIGTDLSLMSLQLCNNIIEQYPVFTLNLKKFSTCENAQELPDVIKVNLPLEIQAWFLDWREWKSSKSVLINVLPQIKNTSDLDKFGLDQDLFDKLITDSWRNHTTITKSSQATRKNPIREVDREVGEEERNLYNEVEEYLTRNALRMMPSLFSSLLSDPAVRASHDNKSEISMEVFELFEETVDPPILRLHPLLHSCFNLILDALQFGYNTNMIEASLIGVGYVYQVLLSNKLIKGRNVLR